MKNQLITFMAGLSLAFTSCVDMDMVPKSQGNSESWYTTETELKMAVNEFYILGYWKMDSPESMEQYSDNFTYRNTNRKTLLDGTLNGQTYEVYHLWQQSYKLIVRANSLLEGVERARNAGLSEEVINQYEGEAYFARACKYADLIFYWGDVPYLDKYMTITEAERMGRKPKAELIPLVYEDFDKAIEYLPVSYGSEAEHFTKGAAYAMKARFALYMSDWEIAAKAAKDCMDLGIYSLEADFSKLFLQSTKSNPEKIFVIPRSIANEVVLTPWIVKNELPRNAGGYGSDNPSWDLLAAFLCTDGLPIDESPLFDPRNPFKNRDPRCAQTIVEFETAHCGFEYNPRPDAKEVMNYSTGKKQSNQDSRAVQQYASYNGLLWKKCIDASWTENGQQVESDQIFMRYADVLLMYAEAKIELNEIDNSVLNAINSVRARAYGVDAANVAMYPAVTTTDQTELRKTVRIERRMELANEGLRYMDLIRWKLASKALNSYNYIMLAPDDLQNNIVAKGLWFWPSTPLIDDDGLADFSTMYNAGQIAVGAKRVFPDRQYLWPIPTHDMELCPNLGNNDGY
ncbi:MAG: RagB/SusD family nutrient uptake outer membrane protein [Bacteroides clarus]|uniref:RagB/SusD family nutrient uptake outer membrane protein n=1 Tax=Bacteroides clarus TaxID=626929 RepID=UPI00241C602D|nr:RagB/SusD family nutrient uptake outer membrane protein [Bacteroides clarus]MBD9144900.1 RagB/SusD family nutrient uptake outer membrane protein [Bacteroides clarus]